MPLKRWVPKWLKRPVKKAMLDRQLSRSIKDISRLEPGQAPTRPLLSKLIEGWSNDGFVANLEYLDSVAAYAVKTQGPILECGSGVTTVLLGILCAPRKIDVWTLEHSREWQERLVRVLESHDISGARVCFASLIEDGEFAWYDPPLDAMPREFSLVICDGPPGTTKGGRYGLLPIMGQRLPAGSVVLLDDADRPGEIELIQRWESEFGFETQIIGENHRFAVMKRH